MTGASPVASAAQEQRRASDPSHSVWVGASAGTGKTKVLTDRVLNLLLQGTPPHKLLCLTFTKAAAAEMANRVIEQLEGWTVASTDELTRRLTELTGSPPDADALRRAPLLFAQVLDTAGGLKIQTIHAFCQSLLGRFPLEAGVAPHFAVLDDASAAELMWETREALLGSLQDGAHPALAEALGVLTGLVREDGFDALIRSLLSERGRFDRLVKAHGDIDGLTRELASSLSLKPGETAASIEAAAMTATPLSELRAAIPAIVASPKSTDQKTAEILLRVCADGGSLDDYAGCLLTEKGEPRKTMVTKDVATVHPEIAQLLADEAERIMAALARRRAAIILAASAALIRIGEEILHAYRIAKERRARLDYDDLILHASNLLKQDGGASWVMYKLDGGIDHILVDEAQDTNPEQWDVIRRIADEFFTGDGQAQRARTLFVVGDAKQSIFSFQRADPAAFVGMRRYFQERAAAAKRYWRPVDLSYSFRSTAAVLNVVDAVFAQEAAKDGVAEDVAHSVSRVGEGGLVELWPVALSVDAPKPAPWSPPIERASLDSPQSRVALLIAKRIAAWLKDGEMLESQQRPVRAGDILVLVRKRGRFVEELVRALKQLDVPTAGVDRMILAEQLAVMDLMALGRFVLLPEDDLNLACLLKSPLVGLSEDDLFELAYKRSGSLWQSIVEKAQENAAISAAHHLLSDWAGRADFVQPYEFFAAVLGPDRGRERLLARLGEEAADPIDEFLAQALTFEQSHVPSLQGFLHWLDSGGLEVKRDGDTGSRDEVRVMTVHGAKGLQAPIVFLPDTMDMQVKPPTLFWPDDGPGPIWSSGQKMDDPVAAALRARAIQAAEREYRRLLYVALTRPADRLYVCGWQTQKNGKPGCWYDLIAQGIATIGTEAEFDFSELGFEDWRGAGWRVETRQTTEPKPGKFVRAALSLSLPLPGWASESAPIEPVPTRPLTPSQPSEEPPVRSPLASLDDSRFKRGTLIHRLLQTLPDLAGERREDAARRFLSSPVHGLTDGEIEATLAETMAVIDHPEFSALFQPGSRAEVPLIGQLGSLAIAGQIDRLAVTADQALIIDYKTNRPPPLKVADVAPAYLRQMAAYRGLIRQIYPAHQVRALLLWTDGPRLMELPSELLDQVAFEPAPDAGQGGSA
jgi:ATP-dependent helicase/nuclease subunit A